MWLGTGELEVYDFIGFSDEAVRAYCSLNDEERAIFRESYVMFYRACLHIAVIGHAAGFPDDGIVARWLRSTTPQARISIYSRRIYFVIDRVGKTIQVVRIGKCS